MIDVLLVDDHDDNRLTISLLLEDFEDVQIDEAKNGKEAVEMYENKSYDLVFMDIMMPIMDGIEATIIIKNISKKPMIIALSALDDNESKQRMLLAGAEDYLTKPIDSELFTQRVKNYLDILNFRETALLNANANNPFTTAVYDREVTFYIKDESSIAQFWDFFLNLELFDCYDLSDHIRIIYGFCKWLLKNDVIFTIRVEANDEELFIMLNRIDVIKKHIIKSILSKYLPNSTFLLEYERLSFRLKKVQVKEKKQVLLDEDTKKILSKTHLDNPSAQEYVENTAISIMPKLESLEKIENSLDALIISFEKELSKDSMELVCIELDEYCGVIELLTEFEHLVFALKTLITFLRTLGEEQFKHKNINNFISQLLNLLHDLSSWREIIFIKQEAIDIHYLDASLLSSCLQLEAIFEETQVDEGDDLEFF